MWIYEGTEITSHKDLHPDCTDIVYCIEYVNGCKYIGKKTVRSTSTMPVLKTKVREGAELITRHILRDSEGKIITSKKDKKLARAAGVKAKAEHFEKLVTDKPFLKYEGSLDKAEVPEIKCKEILYQCSTKKTATYIETHLLFEHNAIFSEKYLNKNIAGTHFDNALDGLLEFETIEDKK